MPIPLEEAEEEMVDSVLGESLYETEFNGYDGEEEKEREEEEQQQNEEEEEQQQQDQEEILLEEILEEEVEEENYGEEQLDYIDIQAEIILSDIERKLMWDKYKYYVDEIVFMGLQDATLCR